MLDLVLQLCDLLLVLLDDLLAEVRSFGKLFLDLFVILQVFGQVSNYRLHFVIFEHQVLSALRLVVQLSSELHVLNDCKFGSTLQLILVGHRVLHSDLSDLHQHVFPELVNLLDTVALDAFNQSFVRSLLLIYHVLLHFQLI